MEVQFRPIQTSGLPLREKLMIELWKIVQCTLFRCSPRRCRAWRRFLLSLFGADLARTVSIHGSVRIHCPWKLKMDDYASLGDGCWIYSLDRVSIGAYSCLSQNVWVVTGSHNIDSSSFDLVTRPVNIGKGCWLAAGSRILGGVDVGDYAVVGCSSVVAKRVEMFDVVAGNPAKFIRKRALPEQESHEVGI